MAAGPFIIPAPAKLNLAEGLITLTTDTLIATLISASYTPQISTDATWANVSANEITGTGYTAGGQVLAGAGITYYLASAAIAVGGTAYAQTDVGKVVTVGGGTSSVAATITISQVNGGSGTGAVTGIAVAAGGTYTVNPANPASTSGGGTTGSGLTVTGIWGAQFAATNPSWATSTITAKYLVVLQRAGGSVASTDKMLGYIDLNTASTSSTVSSTAGTFTVQFNSGASAGTLFTLS